MLYLVEYDRDAGRLVQLGAYAEAHRPEIEDARLELELALNRRGLTHEVVILEAASEQALRRTHRRYFESAGEIARSAG